MPRASKPLSADFVSTKRDGAAAQQVDDAGSADQVFNHEELIGRCMGNEQLVERILNQFGSQSRSDVAELRKALDDDDAERAVMIAHRLKGASANLTAAAVSEQAAQIVSLSKAGDIDAARPCLEKLEEQICRFKEQVDRWQAVN